MIDVPNASDANKATTAKVHAAIKADRLAGRGPEDWTKELQEQRIGEFSGDGSAIDLVTSPTGDAIDNMTDLAGSPATPDAAPIIVNNTTPAPPAPGATEPNIAVMPATVRTSDSVIQRYQDKRFRV